MLLMLWEKTNLNGCFRSWFHGYLMHYDANIQSIQCDADSTSNIVWRANRNQFWFYGEHCDAIRLINRIATTTTKWRNQRQYSYARPFHHLSVVSLVSCRLRFAYFHNWHQRNRQQSVTVRRFGANKLLFLLLNVKRSGWISANSFHESEGFGVRVNQN